MSVLPIHMGVILGVPLPYLQRFRTPHTHGGDSQKEKKETFWHKVLPIHMGVIPADRLLEPGRLSTPHTHGGDSGTRFMAKEPAMYSPYTWGDSYALLFPTLQTLYSPYIWG